MTMTNTNAAAEGYTSSHVDITHIWLAEISYKPGWRFELRTAPEGFSAVLFISAYVPDPNVQQCMTTITHSFMIAHHQQLQDRETFLATVLAYTKMVEVHEAMEYFKASGVRVCNPHSTAGEVLYH